VNTTINIAIFISGRGTNAKNIINYFSGKKLIKVVLVLSTKENQTISSLCQDKNIDFITPNATQLSPLFYLKQLQELNIDWIILAGFLRKIPQELISKYPKKIINLHPSLLPSFGGKGMYGDFVHQAVLASGVEKSGITIHFVNEEFDKGEIIAQFSCKVDSVDTVSMLASKVHALEQLYFPGIIEKTISE
jgi:phosphoribosylglycinamide formyltransferase-1